MFKVMLWRPILLLLLFFTVSNGFTKQGRKRPPRTPSRDLHKLDGKTKGLGSSSQAPRTPSPGRSAADMWPPLPSLTPITPLPKELDRLKKLVVGAPGVSLDLVKPKVLKSAPLHLVHPLDLSYPGLRLCHLDPPIFVVEDFLSGEECDALVALSADNEQSQCVGSPTFGAAPGRHRGLVVIFRIDLGRKLKTI